MKVIKISIPGFTYDVFIGNVLTKLINYVDFQQEVLVITDENVYNHHFHKLIEVIPIKHVFILSKNPEQDKNILMYEKCVDYALKRVLDRKLTVIAFGGGAVGDFAGFFASTYKRGVRLINLPTTLLAHDSAIGGKTALNVGNVKNAIGTFYQPEVVLYHTPFLKTLPYIEFTNGFGEILKHDLLTNGVLFKMLLNDSFNLEDVLSNQELLDEIIYQGIFVKKFYIERDPYEMKGEREYLNLGHTLGHALERLYNLKHGIAVSIGIGFDLFLSDSSYILPYMETIKKLGILTSGYDLSLELIIDILKNDKKNRNDKLMFIGLKDFGKPFHLELTTKEFTVKFSEFMRLYL
ncbi:MAG: 3-dehydroquinate synthase [Bacilli bacterium]|nr:3-dehydroquinate synthase [Bacilli bacterium]